MNEERGNIIPVHGNDNSLPSTSVGTFWISSSSGHYLAEDNVCDDCPKAMEVVAVGFLC
jgi:hypothetical protein